MHHQSAPERFPLYSLEKRKEDILKILEQGYLFYAKFHSQIVGFASVLRKKESFMIEHLYILPEHRHKKIATKIVESIFKKFLNQEIFASVYAFNSEAIEFYKALFELSSLVFKRKK
ncbi:MAG: hypothetical protein CK425_05805 [Parachlamydia sp.]|nr:MAG: hypothetical protein CK425_05805 [Parachlamydia sp.]